jgi:hypothetical protein
MAISYRGRGTIEYTGIPSEILVDPPATAKNLLSVVVILAVLMWQYPMTK